MSTQRKEENKIIGLSGYAKSGKDTVGQYLVSNYGFNRVAFADSVRQGVYALNPFIPNGDSFVRLQTVVDSLGWDTAKEDIPEVRRLLQLYGTEAGRDIHGQNIWIDNLQYKVETLLENSHVVITDVRFENEFEYVESVGGTIMRVTREGVGKRFDHASESGPTDADFIIENNGTLEDLYNSVDVLMEKLGAVKLNVSRN